MSCTGVKPGDAAFWVVNPPDEAAMLALVNIPGTVGSLFLTDRAWNGTDLVGLEGVMEMKLPAAGLQPGERFGTYGDTKASWQAVNGTFNMAPWGDNIFLYCLDDDSKPHFIHGMSTFGAWSAPGLEGYDVNQSALPGDLIESHLALEGFSSWRYNSNALQSGSPDQMKAALSDEGNWEGSDITYGLSSTASSTHVLVALGMCLLWKLF